MEVTRPQRRLAAVLAIDIAGYSLLMAADEEGTHRRAVKAMSEIVGPHLAAAQGRLVKNTGDGGLAEFPSVVDALRCAVEIQRVMARCEAALPLDRRIRFRMGLSLGDVIVEQDDVYGGGVNIAARLQALADPGGVVLSNSAANSPATLATNSSTSASGR